MEGVSDCVYCLLQIQTRRHTKSCDGLDDGPAALALGQLLALNQWPTASAGAS